MVLLDIYVMRLIFSFLKPKSSTQVTRILIQLQEKIYGIPLLSDTNVLHLSWENKAICVMSKLWPIYNAGTVKQGYS